MSDRLTYPQVVAVLAELHSIRPEHLVAFKGRLQNFQRLGFPPGTNTGRGKPATYSFDTLMQLVVALELTQAGLPPAIIVAILTDNWPLMREACVLAAMPDDLVETQDTDWPDGDLFFVLSPTALQSLAKGEGEWFDKVEVVHRSQLLEWIVEPSLKMESPWRQLTLHARFLVSVAKATLLAVRPDVDWPTMWLDLKNLAEAESGPLRIKLKDPA